MSIRSNIVLVTVNATIGGSPDRTEAILNHRLCGYACCRTMLHIDDGPAHAQVQK